MLERRDKLAKAKNLTKLYPVVDNQLPVNFEGRDKVVFSIREFEVITPLIDYTKLL